MAWTKLDTKNGDGTAAYDTGVFIGGTRIYLNVMKFTEATTALNDSARLGNTTIDTGSVYSYRSSQNGTADSTATSQTSYVDNSATSDAGEVGFTISNIVNIATEEKLILAFRVDNVVAGAATAPNRRDIVAKWVETTNQCDVIGAFSSSGTYNASSNISVLGTD